MHVDMLWIAFKLVSSHIEDNHLVVVVVLVQLWIAFKLVSSHIEDNLHPKSITRKDGCE